ncbi:hypothetical protein [Escherichia coli]|uniref:hypothetical protein n=1 Tax=Escherichia coli TaxID=562 RepID=UPI00280AE32C|nr:hypothetical protein [Escherichia coli]
MLISESAWEEMTCLFAPSIMEYSERNVRQLASNEQEEYIPRKINVGVINTPTLIRSDY